MLILLHLRSPSLSLCAGQRLEGPQTVLPMAGLRVCQVHAHCGATASDGSTGV